MDCKEADCTNEVRARGWCQKHYFRWKRHGSPSVVAHAFTVEERFAKYVERGSVLDCWEWKGARSDNGYGVCGDGRYAHRVALELAGSPVPKGMEACHHCDNPPCCNPWHLFVGTYADNTRDMVEKGRGRKAGATRQ